MGEVRLPSTAEEPRNAESQNPWFLNDKHLITNVVELHVHH